MDLDAYFARIGYGGDCRATAETLRAITTGHVLSIPFENISVLVAGAPALDLAALESKLVQRRRGGYCYEQNGLLLAALQAIGYDVVPLSARVRLNLPGGTVTPRSHMVLCVRLDEGRFLVDVGFGRLTPTAPLRLDCDDAQTTPHEPFRVRAHEHGTLLQAQVQDVWRDVYTFDFVPQLPIDYIQQNWHTATRPGAIFANNLVACLPTPHGRHTLLNRTLTWRGRDGTEARQMVGDRDALGTALETVFGLAATESELAVAWDVSGRGDAHTPVFS